jgi:outer membrane protein OmpA-like peptidoglycan-associated protein
MNQSTCGCPRCAHEAEFSAVPGEWSEWSALEEQEHLCETRRPAPSRPRLRPELRRQPSPATILPSSHAGYEVPLVLDGFERGDYRLRPQHLEALRALSIRLRDAPPGPGAVFQIRGYTDNNGGAAMNSALGFARALEACAFLAGALAKLNVPTELRPSSGAEREPVASNVNEEGRRRNRRVEVRLHKSLGVQSPPPPDTSPESYPSGPSGGGQSQPPPPDHPSSSRPEPPTFIPLPTIPLPWTVSLRPRPRPRPPKVRGPRRRR